MWKPLAQAGGFFLDAQRTIGRFHPFGLSSLIGALLRLVEWIIHLPPSLETDYLRAARQLEQEHEMSYVTIAERHGIAKGRIEGRTEGQADLLLRLIQRRFGPVPDDVNRRIQTAQTEQLRTWSLNILDATTLEDVFQD